MNAPIDCICGNHATARFRATTLTNINRPDLKLVPDGRSPAIYYVCEACERIYVVRDGIVSAVPETF
jgi:hypothetical protein